MEHWFVKWLNDKAKKRLEKSQFYAELNTSNSIESQNALEAFEDEPHEIIEWVNMYKEDYLRFKNLAVIIEDMIQCGAEKQAYEYYDAKQMTESNNFPLRPKLDIRQKVFNVSDLLENLMSDKKHTLNQKELNLILQTIDELNSMGMHESALHYYFIKRRMEPELNLPSPDTIVD